MSLDELGFEDQEILLQVLEAAALTQRQRECLAWQLAGLTQEQVGKLLGITQQVVAEHFAAALNKAQTIAPEYL